MSIPRSSLTILVSGMIAADPHQGGATWATLQYVLGLRRLGHEVWLVEPVRDAALQPAGAALADSTNAAYFRQVINEFGLTATSALLRAGTTQTIGASYDVLREVSSRSDVLLNLSGLLTDQALTARIPRRVYLDLDPGFTQLWQSVQGIDMRLEGHTHFATLGSDIGRPGCRIPTLGRSWIGTLPPVVLEHWPVAQHIEYDGLTTVGQWRSYGSVAFEGVTFGQRVHCFRQFMGLPKRTTRQLMPALAIHPDECKDIEALAGNGWLLLDPARLCATPSAYRAFVQGSMAELNIPKSGYVAADCGWFSDRSACYLASGRPVLAVETGFSRHLPSGAGLLSFRTLDEAVAGITALERDYPRHALAARALATQYLDSDKVLVRLLRQTGISA